MANLQKIDAAVGEFFRSAAGNGLSRAEVEQAAMGILVGLAFNFARPDSQQAYVGAFATETQKLIRKIKKKQKQRAKV